MGLSHSVAERSGSPGIEHVSVADPSCAPVPREQELSLGHCQWGGVPRVHCLSSAPDLCEVSLEDPYLK